MTRVVLDFGISLTCSVAALDSYQLEKERPRFFNIDTRPQENTGHTGSGLIFFAYGMELLEA